MCVVFSSLASSENFSISNDGKVDENVALNSNLDKNLSNPVTIGDLTFGANEVLSEGNEIFEAKDGDPLRHLNIRISGLDGVGVKSVKVMSPSLIDIEIGKVLYGVKNADSSYNDQSPNENAEYQAQIQKMLQKRLKAQAKHQKSEKIMNENFL